MAATAKFIVDPGFQKGLNDFRDDLIRIAKAWQRLEPRVQDTAAEIIAELYKAFLRAGVGPGLSPLTQILKGGNMPPIATLADHVIVVKSQRGVPAVVTFERDWDKIALMQDRGYAIIPTARQREALLNVANDLFGSPSWLTDTNGGVWLVPARPHLNFFSSGKLDPLLGRVGQAIATGKRLPNFKTKRPQPEPYTFNLQHISIDTIQI